MNVIWLDEALVDLDIIYEFIAANSKNRASKLIQKILLRTKQLESFPLSGQVQFIEVKSIKEYRYLVEGHYKIVYRVDRDILFINAVVDTRQNPEKLKL